MHITNKTSKKIPHHISSVRPHALTVFGLDQKQTFRWIVPGRILPHSPFLFCGSVSHVAEVQVRLLYPPVWGHILRLVGLHVLLHGREAGAVLLADGTLVGRSAVVGTQVFDHGGVVPWALVAQLALKRLLACGEQVQKPPIMWKWQKQLCRLKSTSNGNHSAVYFHNVMDNVWIYACIPGLLFAKSKTIKIIFVT